MSEVPHSVFVTLRQAAYDHGFDVPLKEREGWFSYRSASVPNFVRIQPGGGEFRVAVDRGPLAVELARGDWGETDAPDGWRAFAAPDVPALHALLQRIWELANSLPEAPLDVFNKRVAEEGVSATEVEALVKRRIGQDTFREALLGYWGGHCPLTGIDVPQLLRASHIKPWAHCTSDTERLNVYNGLLLAADLDAAFDAGLMTFTAGGEARFSEALNSPARTRLMSGLTTPRLPLTEEHQGFMAWHRERVFRWESLRGSSFEGEE